MRITNALFLALILTTIGCKTSIEGLSEVSSGPICKVDSMEIVDGFYMIGVRNSKLNSKIKINGTSEYTKELRKILRKEFAENLSEERFTEFDLIVVVDNRNNLVEVVNMSSIAQKDKLSDLSKDSDKYTEEVKQYWTDVFGLIDESETERMYNTLKAQSWKSAKCNGKKVQAREWITVNLK